MHLQALSPASFAPQVTADSYWSNTNVGTPTSVPGAWFPFLGSDNDFLVGGYEIVQVDVTSVAASKFIISRFNVGGSFSDWSNHLQNT